MSRGREKQRRTLLYDDPVDCGICSLARDRRAFDETRTVSEVHRSSGVIGTYGMFAGHGGATAADLCARNFVPTLIGDSSLHTDPERAIRNSCQALEAFVMAKSNLDKVYYGTSLLFAMIKDGRLFIANIGNSRAVLFTQDGVQTMTKEHDGSNAEEVERVRKAGGFFEDGKVNNLVPVTRSIGDLEMKDSKHIRCSTRKMTEDIIIAAPDIYCRQLSPRDNCLILATAEVWEHLSNKVLVQVIQEALKHQESPHVAAKRVALAAIQWGAHGPLSVMVMVFPTARMYHGKISPSKKRVSRPSGIGRHSSNADAEEQLNSLKQKQRGSNVPSFVRVAQVEAEQEKATRRSAIIISPITSPKGSTAFHADEKMRSPHVHSVTTNQISTQFSTIDVPPTRNLNAVKNHTDIRHQYPSQRRKQIRHQGDGSKKRAESAIGIESVSCFPDDQSDLIFSRKQIDMERKVPMEKMIYYDRKPKSSARAKTTVVSRISELTASGITGDEMSAFGSLGRVEPDSGDFIGTFPSGPSKVRYREDGSIHTGRFWFLKDLGRTFVRKR